jgi:hypothetical protein
MVLKVKSRRGEWLYGLTANAPQGRPYKCNITIHYSLFTIHYSLFTIHLVMLGFVPQPNLHLFTISSFLFPQNNQGLTVNLRRSALDFFD